MTDYKPGTVAIATVRGVPNVRVLRRSTYMQGGEYQRDWAHTSEDAEYTCTPDNMVTDVRPLVVLDLGEQPEKYGADLMNVAMNRLPMGDSEAISVHAIATQIEEQTKPPRIPEPGLWGVVEDDRGCRYLRTGHGKRGWVNIESGNSLAWDEIDDGPTLIREGVGQ